MASVVINGDTSGSITLSAPAIAGSNTLTLPASTGTVLTTASTTGISGSAISTGVVAEAYGGTGTTAGNFNFKNRIINGAMVIDQRNAGASVTATTANLYTVDRWQAISAVVSSKYSFQQNSGSVTPPAGFTNYLGCVSLSAYSIGSTDQFMLQQGIEGYNIADLAWGTASAATVTLSFWVRSSLTGTFGGAVRNGTSSYAYPFTYTISSANTWEQKTITVTGPTSGTWNTTNSGGIYLTFSLGVGSTYSATAGSWTSSSNIFSATGATSVVGTNGATFYITGVQLEKGSTATSFDYRPYGTELALCQRYYWKRLDTSLNTAFATVACYSATDARGSISYSQMRTAPNVSFSGSFFIQVSGSIQPTVTSGNMSASSVTDQTSLVIASTSGLTTGQAGLLLRASGTCFIDASAEL